MSETKTVEYSVKPETRYVVWKHVTTPSGGSVQQVGSYETEAVADLAVDACVAVDKGAT